MNNKPKPNKISMFIRSLLFGIIVPIFTVFYSLLCVAVLPLPLKYRYPVTTGWTKSIVWLLKTICKIDYHVEGFENIPQDRCGIVLSKHQSAWETFYLPNQFHQTAIILKRELNWVPFFGWGLAATSPIAINRSDRSSAMSQVMTKGKKCLEEGRWILVFPEGTRIAPGEIGKYRLGGARLAVDAGGYPIIPVAHNAGRFWPRRKFIKKPGTVQVRIGPVIETKGRSAEEVMAQAKDWIEKKMLEIDGE